MFNSNNFIAFSAFEYDFSATCLRNSKNSVPIPPLREKTNGVKMLHVHNTFVILEY